MKIHWPFICVEAWYGSASDKSEDVWVNVHQITAIKKSRFRDFALLHVAETSPEIHIAVKGTAEEWAIEIASVMEDYK